jgi:hypothetical protein
MRTGWYSGSGFPGIVGILEAGAAKYKVGSTRYFPLATLLLQVHQAIWRETERSCPRAIASLCRCCAGLFVTALALLAIAIAISSGRRRSAGLVACLLDSFF